MERIKQGGGGNICNIQYTACLFIELTAMGIKTFVYGNKSKDMEQELKEGERTKKHVIFMCMFLVAPSWMDIDDAFPEYFQMIPKTGGNFLGGISLNTPNYYFLK